MLTKKYRLNKTKDIENISKTKPFFSKFLNVRVKKNDLENSRFCVIISKKVDKRATTRNKIKRQIGEIIRLNLDKIKNNQDVVIAVKNTIMNKEAKKIAYDYNEIEKNLLWIFKKTNLLK